jgi:hypothetical protein
MNIWKRIATLSKPKEEEEEGGNENEGKQIVGEAELLTG